MRRTAYDDAFFDEKEDDVLSSARALAPLLMELLAPRSVVDVGCGRGGWLAVFHELGVGEVRGLDGDHVNRARLLIDPASFTAVDLSRSFAIDGRFDLALCLEAAEHLPAAAGPPLVATLVAAAPAVLFSAAVPGQGGTKHVNERWPAYWESLFARRGYARVDAIRRRACYDMRVKWWYRQNAVLYASRDAIADHDPLRRELELTEALPLEWVHVRVLERYLLGTSTLRGLLARLPAAAWSFVRRERFRGVNEPP